MTWNYRVVRRKGTEAEGGGYIFEIHEAYYGMDVSSDDEQLVEDLLDSYNDHVTMDMVTEFALRRKHNPADPLPAQTGVVLTDDAVGIHGDTLDDLREDLALYQRAFDLPVLDYETGGEISDAPHP